MDSFRCPICDKQIGFFKKIWESTWGKGIIECPFCGSKLKLKLYGTGRTDAGIIVLFTYYILGVKELSIPVYALVTIIFLIIKKIFTPLTLYDPEKKMSAIEWIVFIILAMILLYGLLFNFFEK